MSVRVSANHAPASNTAAIATLAASTTGQVIRGMQVMWSYDLAPTAGTITIKDGTTVIAVHDIPTSGPGFMPIQGLQSSINATLSATLSAGGSGVSGKVTLTGHYS